MIDINKGIQYQKSAFLWNIIGSICYAASSLFYMLMVTRISGAFDAGIFAIAFANAQLMLTIGKYGMRTFQATDLKDQFSFKTYLTSRTITCAAMVFFNVGYIIFRGYTLQKAQIVLWVCLMKMVDAVEDVFHALLQKNNRLDIAGKLLTARNIFSVVVFVMALIITKQLLLTCILTTVFSFAFCFLTNIPSVLVFEKMQLDKSFKSLKKLFIECTPLFASSFLSLYIYNAPKYAIDNYLTSDIQTYYGILFMPTFVINLFSEFAFKPLLTSLTEVWLENRRREFLNKIIKLLKWIVFLTVIVLAGGSFLGIPILSFVYNVELSSFKIDFMMLLLGGGFGATVWLLNNILTAMRKQRELLLGYLGVSIFSSIISPLLVQKIQILGASVTYLFSISLLSMFFLVLLFYFTKQKIKQ